MIGQSKKHSLLESLLNIAIGYGIAISVQILVFPWFGIQVPLHDNLMIGGIFTIVSLIRSYVLRRCFNWWHMRGWNKACALGNKKCSHGTEFRYHCEDCDIEDNPEDHK